ncbi:hypothetical protein BCR43DRAFT_493766 [Syncephalastrum racemosum]|uniref:Uncharacterized protein n=1 Tax=Syncephalastrum racemosum TaxID=13706 RepID=A0A1X2HB65_SYNRA|nr:hypothetical protein BCR43DRAFT_493766 [Syncephalastrum racemosum]
MQTSSKAAIITFIIASLAYATAVAVWALVDAPGTWTYNLLNARPARGEMGLGRFTIRGTRYINGHSTPFAYAWRSAIPNPLGRWTAWAGYSVHQLGQWLILAQFQKKQQQTNRDIRWSTDTRWWNTSMVLLNSIMMVYKLVQTHVAYDGLAIDVSEGTAQGSVIAVLVVALILAIPRRGILFGKGGRSASTVSLFGQVLDFVKRYHGYVMSFGTVYNFHYHPAEGTLGHFGGFFYQCLLLWQSSSFMHQSHRNRLWILLLETFVFFHGTLTALCQPGSAAWQIFSFGFAILFFVNQLYDLVRPSFKVVATGFSLLIAAAAYGFHDDPAYYRMTFIPLAQYTSMLLCLGLGIMTALVVNPWSSARWRRIVVAAMYVGTSALLTVGMAVVLAGNLKVYNDY